MNFIKKKNAILILMLAAMQVVPLQAMLLPTMRTALAGANIRALSSAQGDLNAHLQISEQMHHDTKQNRSQLWKLGVAGSVVTAAMIASSAQERECSAQEIKNPYGGEFFQKAGFAEGLPYWYLVEFANKLGHFSLNDDVNVKIELSNYIHSYQPSYLSQDERVPVWDGKQWDRSSDWKIDRMAGIGGIKISIVDNHDQTVYASCYLTPAGTVNFVKVDKAHRGKGFGRLLLTITKQIALEAGISKLHLHVWPYDLHNTSRQDAWEPTIRFYQKNGFLPDRMFCHKRAEVWFDSDYSRMVYPINSDEKAESSKPHACLYCDSTERLKATLAIGACTTITAACVWWCCREIKKLL